MKYWKFLVLAVLSLMLWSEAAAASVLYRYTALITTPEGRMFALRSLETDPPTFPPVWSHSEIVEVDYPNVRLIARLEDGPNSAKNTPFLVYHNGMLYVASIGGAQGWGLEAGDVWVVDIAGGTQRQIRNFGNRGVQGLAIANDGTMFLLLGRYHSDDNWNLDWRFDVMLFITNVSDMSIGTEIPLSGDGFSWGIAWSEDDRTLWVMAGTELQARGKDGQLLNLNNGRPFTPAQLGSNIYSISPREGGGLFYAVSDYSAGSGSIGFIAANGIIRPNLATGLGGPRGDAGLFAFRDHRARHRLLVRERISGSNDLILIYNPDDFSGPIVNTSEWRASNILAVATLGNYLYYATYESYNPVDNTQLSGVIGRVDMSLWQEDPLTQPSSGGGGCDSGFGMAVLLLLVPMTLFKYRKR